MFDLQTGQNFRLLIQFSLFFCDDESNLAIFPQNNQG